MNTPRLSAILAALALFAFLTTPAWGVSKEIVQLQTQVQALQEQMTHMQQSFDERPLVDIIRRSHPAISIRSSTREQNRSSTGDPKSL